MTSTTYASGGIAKYTPVLIRVNKQLMTIDTMEGLEVNYGKEWVPSTREGKEIAYLRDVECWSDEGWTTLQAVERFVISGDNPMWRVVTPQGILDTTIDQPLLTSDGSHISVLDCQVNGYELLHHTVAHDDTELVLDRLALICEYDCIEYSDMDKPEHVFENSTQLRSQMYYTYIQKYENYDTQSR